MKISVNQRAAKVARQSVAINRIRDALRDAPVTLGSGVVVDADRDSVLMMEETIAMWEVITYMRDDQGRQRWKDSENVIRAFTREEFSAFVAEVRQRRAARMDFNFAFAELKRQQLPLPDDDTVFDPQQWPG